MTNKEPEKLPFESEEFSETWGEWIQYRTERRLPKYVPTGLKKTFAKLVRECSNDEKTAIAMINQSMESNYQGIFPLKNQVNGTNKQGIAATGKPGTSEARIAAARKF